MRDDYKLHREKKKLEGGALFFPMKKPPPPPHKKKKKKKPTHAPPFFAVKAWHITPWRKRSLLHLPDLRAEAESLA